MDTDLLKIKRAERHLSELKTLFRKKRPFEYCLRTNYKTGERSTYVKEDMDAIYESSIIMGDVIHNLRSAIDHTYWQNTEKYEPDEKKRRKIQFPIVDEEGELKNRIGDPKSFLSKLPKKFVDVIEGLRPFRTGGNSLLCHIHDLDIIDKHKALIPTADFTRLDSSALKAKIPDFPDGIENVGLSNNACDVSWVVDPKRLHRIGKKGQPNVVDTKLSVNVYFVIPKVDQTKSAVEVLESMIELTKDAVNKMNEAAK